MLTAYVEGLLERSCIFEGTLFGGGLKGPPISEGSFLF